MNYWTILTYFYIESGFITDEEVKQRESVLRNALKNDNEFQVKAGASVEVAQVICININEVVLHSFISFVNF